jgi:UvrD/REP helicase.
LLIDERINSSIVLNEKKSLEKIRRQLVSANISTIHSFCIDILKQYPVEAQLDARFIPIDENLSNELIEISVEEMIRSAFDNELVT